MWGRAAEACAGVFGVEPAVGSPPGRPACLLPRCCAAPGGAGRPLAGGLLAAHACLHARPCLCGDRVNKARPVETFHDPWKGGVCVSKCVGSLGTMGWAGGQGVYPMGAWAWARAGLHTSGPLTQAAPPHPELGGGVPRKAGCVGGRRPRGPTWRPGGFLLWRGEGALLRGHRPAGAPRGAGEPTPSCMSRA